MGTLMSIPCEFSCVSLYDIQEINSSFAVGTLKVMYLGNNRNGSHFSKDAVEKALPSLRNVPIVCHWDDEAEEIGGHDIAVVADNDGALRIKNLTEPCGVVPDHARFKFQIECDEDGNEHEYLVIDGVILWKRQDVYRYIVDELGGKVKHSMEINVIDNKKTEDGYLDITNFEFTALCLLGNCTPCFQGSELELFTAQNFKLKMEQMMLEMKESFSKVNTSSEDDIHPQKCSMEGGEKVLNEKMDLVAKYGIDVEKLDFSIDDFTVEELEEKFKAFAGQPAEEPAEEPKAVEEPATDGDNKDGEGSDGEKFALESNVREELIRVLESEKVQREWGECTRYWFVDYDKDAHIVYCWDTNDWLLYGFEYEVNGDSITIKQDTKKRKKFDIVDFDEGEQPSPFEQVFAMMERKIKSNTELEAKYQTASDTIASMKTELDELRRFKSDTEATIAQGERDEVFARFEDLVGVEAFDELKENAANYDTATLEEKCFAIRGRNSVVKFSAEQAKSPKLKVEKTDITKAPYGGLFEQYGVAAKQ